MRHNFIIARPYAKAAFALALEQDALDYWWRALEFLAAVMSDTSLQNFFMNPKTRTEVVLALFENLSANLQMKDEMRRFVELLITNERLALAPSIAALYRQFYLEKVGAADVTLTSAAPLNEEWHKRFQELLSKKFQRKINLTLQVDKKLLGGVLIKMNDTVIDATIFGKLQKVAQQLTLDLRNN